MSSSAPKAVVLVLAYICMRPMYFIKISLWLDLGHAECFDLLLGFKWQGTGWWRIQRKAGQGSGIYLLIPDAGEKLCAYVCWWPLGQDRPCRMHPSPEEVQKGAASPLCPSGSIPGLLQLLQHHQKARSQQETCGAVGSLLSDSL